MTENIKKCNTGRDYWKNTGLLRSAPTAIKDLLIKIQMIFHKVPTFSSRLFVIQSEKLN